VEQKKGKLFVLGFGFFGVSIIWPLYNAYVPIFLQETFLLSAFLTGVVMTIDNIFAIFMLPIIGSMSDQTRTKIGRRMPYILLGAPLAAIFFALIPIMRNTEKLFLMMFIIILMNFFMALFRSPVIALMPDITPPKKRSQANGVINFMGGLGALLAYFAGKPLYDANNNYPFFAGAILLLISSILVVTLIKEDKQYTVKIISENKNQNNTAKRGMQELMVNLKDVFASKEKSLLFMLLSILMWFIAFNALETFFTSYAQFHVGVAASTGTLILGVFSLTFMITAIPAGFLGSKIGRKKTIFIGITILILIVLSTYLFGNMEMNESNRDLFVKIMFVLFPIGGIGWALINVNSLPMIVDMTTNEKSGGYTGLYYFFSMAANIIAPPVAGLFVDVFSYSSLMIFTIVFFIFAGITMTRVKRGEVVKNES